jgi:hypothetical protein
MHVSIVVKKVIVHLNVLNRNKDVHHQVPVAVVVVVVVAEVGVVAEVAVAATMVDAVAELNVVSMTIAEWVAVKQQIKRSNSMMMTISGAENESTKRNCFDVFFFTRLVSFLLLLLSTFISCRILMSVLLLLHSNRIKQTQ